MADITMPQLGETVTEGTIIKWHKSVGDKIAEDEVLFEVSTDKVDSEVPSSVSGYLTEILVSEGETVDVGTKLAEIGETAPAAGNGGTAPARKAVTEEIVAAVAEESGEAKAEDPRLANGDGGVGAVPEAVATDGAQREAAKAPPEAAAAPARAGGSKLLSPVVRKLIAEHHLDPGQIAGSGQDGRITRGDVLAHIDKGAAPQPAAAVTSASAAAKAAPSPAPRQAKVGSKAGATADAEVVAFSNIRRRTAEHMVRSQATAAHVLTAIEVDFDAVDRVRRQVREEFKAREGVSLTYLPFVARAVVDAISEFPHVNSSVGDDQLVVHRRIHLGIAVDLSFEGLIVPVISDADGQRLRGLARSMADLARRARSRELTADDISGGTFTITNPGPFGTFLTAPVINQPQVAILSTDGVKKRPVVIELPDGSDAIAVHPVGNLALSFDHRAFDGAYAAAFLARCREILETRDWVDEL